MKRGIKLNHIIHSIAFCMLLGSNVANAIIYIPPTEETFDFSGTCSDCQGSVSAQLVLNNYTLGTNIDLTNFVSFTYDGSNFVNPFTITEAQIAANPNAFMQGVITQNTPSAEALVFDFQGGGFIPFGSYLNGSWVVDQQAKVVADYGINGIWQLASVPEPTSIALLTAGILGFGVSRKNRH